MIWCKLCETQFSKANACQWFMESSINYLDGFGIRVRQQKAFVVNFAASQRLFSRLLSVKGKQIYIHTRVNNFSSDSIIADPDAERKEGRKKLMALQENTKLCWLKLIGEAGGEKRLTQLDIASPTSKHKKIRAMRRWWLRLGVWLFLCKLDCRSRLRMLSVLKF